MPNDNPQTTEPRSWRKVATKDELMAWLKTYPRKLICDVQATGEPPIVMFHDMSLSTDGLSSWATCIACYCMGGYAPEGDYQCIAEGTA